MKAFFNVIYIFTYLLWDSEVFHLLSQLFFLVSFIGVDARQPHNGGSRYLSNSLACIRVKGGESERFRVDSWVRQGCIMSIGFSMYI